MEQLHFAENLVRLRKERKVTQEELAEFVGVTKASVSKWENAQSMPDILLVPQLASFFGVSVDELLGYESQLSKEQIKACYLKFAHEFCTRPFEDVMEDTRRMVKKYYSCYPFLLQICLLWVNHSMLAPDQQAREKVLLEIIKLCDRILEHCDDLITKTQTIELRALADLQLGKVNEVVEALEELCRADCYEQKIPLLTQAYMMQGATENADSLLQVNVYQKLMLLLNNQTMLLRIHEKEEDRCDEIMRRVDALIEIYALQELNPNLCAVYQFQAACVLLRLKREAEGLFKLEQYVESVRILFQNGLKLTADDYFDRLPKWLSELELGAERVRDFKIVIESAKSVFQQPEVLAVTDKERLKKIREKLDESCQVE